MVSPALESGEAMAIPLSLEKKLACVLGIDYENHIDEACQLMHDSFDKCLPQAGATEVDDEAVTSCAREEALPLGKLDFFGMDYSVVTGNSMPDFCSRSFDRKGIDTTDLQARLDFYNDNRQYGWTLESVTPHIYDDETQASEPEPQAKKDEGFILSMKGSQASYRSNPGDAPSVDVAEWSNGEAASTGTESASGTSNFFIFLVAGVAIGGAVLLVFVAMYVRDRFRSDDNRSSRTARETSRKKYSLAMQLDGHEIA